MHEPEVHEKLITTGREAPSRAVGRLFLDIRLFLEIDITKWVGLEMEGCPHDLSWDDIELVFTGRAQSKGPYLRFNLPGACGRSKLPWTRSSTVTIGRFGECSPVGRRGTN
jgi:hypothetical protein